MKKLVRVLDLIAMSVPFCGALYDLGTRRLEREVLTKGGERGGNKH